MELQHINVKLLVGSVGEAGLEAALEPLIPIFHDWIREKVCDELLLDIADYRHVFAGPGVVLIGHQADTSVDNADNRLGVRYNRKVALAGGNQDRLVQAARAALTACSRFEADPRLEGRIRFGGRDVEVFVNDRLVAPNCDATREDARPDFQIFFDKLFRGAPYSLSYDTDPRRLFAVSAKSSQLFTVAALLQNLSS